MHWEFCSNNGGRRASKRNSQTNSCRELCKIAEVPISYSMGQQVVLGVPNAANTYRSALSRTTVRDIRTWANASCWHSKWPWSKWNPYTLLLCSHQASEIIGHHGCSWMASGLSAN
jgi:hypothetical protein